MKPMKHCRTFTLIFGFFSLVPLSTLFAQTYKFRQLGVEDGICYPFVYTINQDANGYLWLGTGEGLCKYDGFNFNGDFSMDSLPEAFVKKSYRDSEGNLWFGHNDGSITLYDGRNFRVIDPGVKITSTINGIAEDKNGRIVFATQNQGIIIINRELQVSVIREPFNGKLLTSLAFTASGDLLVGAYDGLHVYSYDFSSADTIAYLGKVAGVPRTQITSIVYDESGDRYWLGSLEDGLYCLKLDPGNPANSRVVKIGHDDILRKTPVLSVMVDQDGYLWLSTQGEGVYKLRLNRTDLQIEEMVNFNEQNGLGIRFIREVFQDREGNIWICTYGNGLAGLFDEALTFHDYSDRVGSTISSVITDDEGYWMAGTGKLVRVRMGMDASIREYTPANGMPDDKITALFRSGATLWIGTASRGLYRMNISAGRILPYHSSENSLENMINALDGRDGTLWVATNNGVLAINESDGSIQRLSTSDGLPHNRIRDIFVDSKGTVWIATRSNGLYSVNSDRAYDITGPGSFSLEFVSITEDDFGNLWAATEDNGIFRFVADTPDYISTEQGLKSRSCYSIMNDRQGHIWVGHRLGLSKIDEDEGMIVAMGTESGINGDCQPNASAVTPEGVVLFGTSKGLIMYDTKKERRNLTPPVTSISSVIISDREYDFSKPIVLPYGIYKLRVEFIGINYAAPEKVTYQFKLDGYDDWSDPVNIRFVNYGRIEDGNYTFMLRACNSEGFCTDLPATFSLRVKLPVWKTWWFISILVGLLIAVVFFIIKYRERKARQFQEILQKKLDERTREVVMQKEEIEIKNKDITDSINYAQRIQASILPPISKLHETFSGSFVFYQPRDIVSGDFYWYDLVEDNKLVIVCADSTGHGVPGAFMSMIGTTLIKDITVRQEVDSPARLLATLDMEIMAALNQNLEAERSNDGMDIIVSEVNLKTKKLRVSSAMRPMIIYRDGEQIYVRGSRNSVGGEYEKELKMFETNEFQLTKGDKIYMFSDGYPDQFGGPLGKKFKMVRLKNMLRDIHDKPMDEQYNYIKNNFEIWKEDTEQVDDVLFMGIEI
jgi:ligand-binding sensor domain-containing protein/serine phosphatase RsbU (regulator of sigma subunit)